MKHMLCSLIGWFLPFVICFTCLAGCSTDNGNTLPDSNSVTSSPDSAETTLIVRTSKDAPALLVYPFDCLQTQIEIVREFRKQLLNRTEGSYKMTNDGVATDVNADANTIEIIIGDTSRSITATLKTKLQETGRDAFGILVEGNKIAICGTGVYLTYLGLDYFLEAYCKTDGTENVYIQIPKDLEYISTPENPYPDPHEVINSGKKYCFYALDRMTVVPTEGEYGVMQGACTDGTYAYVAMIRSSSSREIGIVYKYELRNWKLVAQSKPMELAHINDITYDSKNHRLVSSCCSASDNYYGLLFIDPDTLESIDYILSPTRNRAVEYIPETNQYILASGYNFHLTNEYFETISTTTCGYPKLTAQGICYDGQYIFDCRYEYPAEYQTVTVNTLDGEFIDAVELYNIETEPESIFRDGNTFFMGCNGSDTIYRLGLVYKQWW